eukprot:3658410-Rhodomonas_salina.1
MGEGVDADALATVISCACQLLRLSTLTSANSCACWLKRRLVQAHPAAAARGRGAHGGGRARELDQTRHVGVQGRVQRQVRVLRTPVRVAA